MTGCDAGRSRPSSWRRWRRRKSNPRNKRLYESCDVRRLALGSWASSLWVRGRRLLGLFRRLLGLCLRSIELLVGLLLIVLRVLLLPLLSRHVELLVRDRRRLYQHDRCAADPQRCDDLNFCTPGALPGFRTATPYSLSARPRCSGLRANASLDRGGAAFFPAPEEMQPSGCRYLRSQARHRDGCHGCSSCAFFGPAQGKLGRVVSIDGYAYGSLRLPRQAAKAVRVGLGPTQSHRGRNTALRRGRDRQSRISCRSRFS